MLAQTCVVASVVVVRRVSRTASSDFLAARQAVACVFQHNGCQHRCWAPRAQKCRDFDWSATGNYALGSDDGAWEL